MATNFAFGVGLCVGIVEPFKHILCVTAHPQILANELWAPMGACPGQYAIHLANTHCNAEPNLWALAQDNMVYTLQIHTGMQNLIWKQYATHTESSTVCSRLCACTTGVSYECITNMMNLLKHDTNNNIVYRPAIIASSTYKTSFIRTLEGMYKLVFLWSIC